jgi:CHAT domain-containing protein
MSAGSTSWERTPSKKSVSIPYHAVFDAEQFVRLKAGLNAAFTWQNFKNDLRQSPKAVVHNATHYDSRRGAAANSQLLMGDGERSLADLASEDKLFHGVDLLTLLAAQWDSKMI